MQRFAFILIGGAALALAGCNGAKQQDAAENAQDNLVAQADNTATNLAEMSANVADANQANALVNESVQLSNAGEAAQNADANAH